MYIKNVYINQHMYQAPSVAQVPRCSLSHRLSSWYTALQPSLNNGSGSAANKNRECYQNYHAVTEPCYAAVLIILLCCSRVICRFWCLKLNYSSPCETLCKIIASKTKTPLPETLTSFLSHTHTQFTHTYKHGTTIQNARWISFRDPSSRNDHMHCVGSLLLA